MYKKTKIHLLRAEEWFKSLCFHDLIQSLFSPPFLSFFLSSYFLLLKLLAEFQVNVILEKIITFVGA